MWHYWNRLCGKRSLTSKNPLTPSGFTWNRQKAAKPNMEFSMLENHFHFQCFFYKKTTIQMCPYVHLTFHGGKIRPFALYTISCSVRIVSSQRIFATVCFFCIREEGLVWTPWKSVFPFLRHYINKLLRGIFGRFSVTKLSTFECGCFFL